MDWFNYWGLIIFAVMMMPNIIYAAKHKETFENNYSNKIILSLEQIGRYGAMLFMIFNIPYVSKGFWLSNLLLIYLVVNGVFMVLYCLIWAIFWSKNTKFKVLALSIIPSVIFLFSGAILLNIPLIIAAVLFAIGHVTVSVKNFNLCADKT